MLGARDREEEMGNRVIIPRQPLFYVIIVIIVQICMSLGTIILSIPFRKDLTGLCSLGDAVENISKHSAREVQLITPFQSILFHLVPNEHDFK
jgi:hypothetical protein